MGKKYWQKSQTFWVMQVRILVKNRQRMTGHLSSVILSAVVKQSDYLWLSLVKRRLFVKKLQ